MRKRMRTATGAAAIAAGIGIVAVVTLGGSGARPAVSGQASSPAAGSTCGIRIAAKTDNREVTTMKATQGARAAIPAIDAEVHARTEIALFALG